MEESEKHPITRVRHDLHLRRVVVRRTEFVTPRMLRLTLAGPALAGFTSLAADDHIKVIVPGSEPVERRDYTPRRFDAATGELTIDFALHEAGPVTQWAMQAKPGDEAEIAGPRGSVLFPNDFDWWLLIGDETALPAIGRWIESMAAGTKVTSIVAVTAATEQQRFETKADHRGIWIHRAAEQSADPEPLLAALRNQPMPPGDGLIWIAAEAKVAAALRQHVVEEIQHPLAWLKASGYWVKGQADSKQSVSESNAKAR
ncbi:siderophore-interacting protein [Phreatobacter aquaticus]|uniref:Siderophore-interacting protein n=1 Tax=Phreatobacter aquaticus TaxID=2570229 RepID=A0A4D7QHW4_9HYPH|nr:siderophore-interacting protein [Phreatobacter aquaticus]QCK86301.1 siderophore-interacting protein [Phreatobacter aquaticus]